MLCPIKTKTKTKLADHIAPQGDGNFFYCSLGINHINLPITSPRKGMETGESQPQAYRPPKLSDHITPQGDGNPKPSRLAWIIARLSNRITPQGDENS